MARPKINPSVRFSDVIPLWEYADAQGAAGFACLSEREATHKLHRLNQARAHLRDYSGIDAHPWDRFVVRKSGLMLKIVPKDGIDLARFVDVVTERPIGAEQVKNVLEGPKNEGFPGLEIEPHNNIDN